MALPCMLSGNKPNVINFYRDKYQAANKNWSIAQDSLGIMYFGNDKGLLEFDGIRWKLYTLPESEVVRAVAVSSKHNLVFTGGYEEFGIWERNVSGELTYRSLSSQLDKKAMHNDDIWRIWVTDSLVYFQSFNHIYTYDYKQVRLHDTGSHNIVFLIHIYDEFWMQKVRDSLFRLQKGALTEIPGSSIFNTTEVRVVLPFGKNQFLIGTSTMGFYLYDGTSFKEWKTDASQAGKLYQVNVGIRKKNGNYFIGTILNGIYEINSSGVIVNHFSTDNFLQNNTILSLFEDNVGNVWTAMDRGISYIQYLKGMDCYINPSGRSGALYSAALLDDKLFLGTNQGVFYIPRNKLNEPGSLSQLKIVDQTQGQVWDIKRMGNQLVCGHNYGLKTIDGNLKVSSVAPLNTGVYKITDMQSKEDNYLLLSTYFVPKILTRDYKIVYSFKDIPEPIISIEPDHLGNIWLGHAQKGLYRCHWTDDIEKIKFLGTYGGDKNDGLPYHLRICKFGGRVLFLGNDKFYVYNDLQDKIMEFDEINKCFEGIRGLRNIVTLTDNLFFVITSDCIYKTFYDGYAIRIVDRFDMGYDNLSMVNSYENIVALDDSTSLICMDNGFLLHKNLQNDSQNDSIMDSPHIRSITLIDSKNKKHYIPSTKNTSIAYRQNTVLFSFFSKNVLANNLYFQYQLQGVHSDWSEPAKIDEILFERLPKGEYTFMLRTVDNLGNHSEPVSFSFTILPPWYASSWAFIGYFFLFLLSMVLIWFLILRRYRNIHLIKVRMREENRLRRQNLNLQKEIEEKNAELFSQASFIIQKNELILKVKREIDNFYNSFSGNKILKPLYLQIERLLNQNMDMDEDWKMFLIQFEQKHTGFFKHLKEQFPELTSNDLKLCACLKLNLSSKDIAALLNISIRGVENSRYRLRKKLNISSSQNLNEIFLDF